MLIFNSKAVVERRGFRPKIFDEEGREKLSQFWTKAYENNINRLIPMIAENLANDIISVTGVKMVSPNQNRRWVSLRP
ncbi:MAG: hypothetical protein ACK47N_07250 [Microcystis sp.]|uniref:hypothetical protein n=1 Tax=Microcystis sp. TaxID=1127 RepID=UPI003919BAA0